MNNDEVEKNIITAIELLGKVVTKNFKIVNDRIANIVNLLTLKENELVEEFLHDRDNVIITQEGHAIAKKKDVPKVAANGKLPEGYKISGTGCKYCSGLVAWAPFIPDKDLLPGQKRPGPVHCDENGNLVGDGRCPKL